MFITMSMLGIEVYTKVTLPAMSTTDEYVVSEIGVTGGTPGIGWGELQLAAAEVIRE
jgi:hypothetical protein